MMLRQKTLIRAAARLPISRGLRDIRCGTIKRPQHDKLSALPRNQRYTTYLVLYQTTMARGLPQLLAFHLVNPILWQPKGGSEQGNYAGAIMAPLYQRREGTARQHELPQLHHHDVAL